jgi:Phytanoyl-CoA dioxygenase (PhyH)
MRPSVAIKRLKALVNVNLHHYVAQRIFRERSTREWISNRVARTKPGAVASEHDASEQDVFDAIARDGYVMLPGLISERQIEEVKSYLQDKLCHNRNRPQLTAQFMPAEAPAGTHIAAYSDSDTVNCPHVMEIANDKRVLRLVESYFKCRPTISNLSIWWSLKTDEEPEEAENFHRDIDDWRQLKLFVYLTDVSDEFGPHVFVRESHRINKALAIKRYTDEEVVSDFGAGRIVTFTGPRGTCFLENTFGLHKGTTARAGDRLLLQVLYTMNPLGVSDYSPVARDATTANVDPYVNRLYVR